jgi:hypothetical protein
MASVVQHRALGRGGWPVALAAALVLGSSPARANDAVGTLQRPCPRITVPTGESYVQPLRLQPSQVKSKNAMGCLSPADAVYGSDGCPQRFCGGQAGAFPMPPANTP